MNQHWIDTLALAAASRANKFGKIVIQIKRQSISKNWDVFISHASEDKEDVALPLSRALQDAGVMVWLDSQQLSIGDSLREKIDNGLAESRFGIVIISPAFLAKAWPRKELNGLFALEEGGEKVILPLWYNVTQTDVARYSPILADRLATDWRYGIERVVKNLIQVIFNPQSSYTPTLKRRFIELLDKQPERKAIFNFLNANDSIITRAVWGSFGPSMISTHANYHEADFASVYMHQSAYMYRWQAVFLGSPETPLFSEAGKPTASVTEVVERLNEFCKWAVPRADVNELHCIIVAGRRNRLADFERKWLRTFRPPDFQYRVKTVSADRESEIEEDVTLEVRTYDWLVERE